MRVEPAVDIRDNETIGRKRKLPLAIRNAAVKRSGPACAESLRRRERDVPRAVSDVSASPDFFHGKIQKRSVERDAVRFVAPEYRSLRLRLPWVARACPNEIKANGARHVPSARNIPPESTRAGENVANLRQVARDPKIRVTRSRRCNGVIDCHQAL